MKISLNKANKIRHLLEGHISNLITKQHSNVYPIALSGAETPLRIAEKVAGVRERSASVIEKIETGIDHLFAIRSIVQKQNAKNGANQIITDLAKKNFTIKQLGGMFNEEVEPFDLSEEIAFKLKVISENAKSTTMARGANTFDATDPVWFNEKVKMIADLKKQVRELEEKRNELNHKSYVEIPTEIEEYLKGENLI